MSHNAFTHRQRASMAKQVGIARRLDEAHAWGGAMAANNWHAGLNVAYAGGRVSSYLGAPLADERRAMTAELAAAGATCYMRWIDRPPDAPGMSIPEPPWRLALVIEERSLSKAKIEVYTRDASPP